MIPFKLNCHVSLTGTCFSTPCSGSCSVQTWLLQCSLGRSSSQFHRTTINPEFGSKINFNEPKRMDVTPLFICLHWLPIAARIKFKALMFPYKTTSGSAPNSLLQIMCPLEVYILQVNVALLCHPKQAQKHFHWLLNKMFSPGEWPA